MIMRWLTWGGALTGGFLILGAMILGTDLPSYIICSTRQVRTAVKESVPIDFELQRAQICWRRCCQKSGPRSA